MEELQGTERQVKFANDVRAYVLFQLEHMEDQEQAQKAVKVINRTSKAKSILDMFAGTFYKKNFVYCFTEMVNGYPVQVKAKKTLSQKYLKNLASWGYDEMGHLETPTIKDVEFVNEDEEKNKTIAKNTKTLDKIIANNDVENIEDFSADELNEAKQAINALEAVDYDVTDYKEAINKLIFAHNDMVNQKKVAETAAEKVESSETSEKDDDVEATPNIKADDKEGKYLGMACYRQFRKNEVIISPNGKKVFRITKVKSVYLSDDTLEELQSTGELERDGYYPAGEWFIFYAVEITDTPEGKEVLDLERR